MDHSHLTALVNAARFRQVLNLNCVVHSISVCVWGPGLALRGATAESMIRYVDPVDDWGAQATFGSATQ